MKRFQAQVENFIAAEEVRSAPAIVVEVETPSDLRLALHLEVTMRNIAGGEEVSFVVTKDVLRDLAAFLTFAADHSD